MKLTATGTALVLSIFLSLFSVFFTGTPVPSPEDGQVSVCSDIEPPPTGKSIACP